MKYNKNNSSHSVLHESDQKRISSLYAGDHVNSKTVNIFTPILIFVLSTWITVFLLYDYVHPKVSGEIQLKNLPFYIGLLGVWILYSVNYSFFFLKKLQGIISERYSSVGSGLVIQSFIYAVMGSAIAVKQYRSEDNVSLSSLFELRIPLIDNPLNILMACAILFAVGIAVIFFSLPAKTASARESVDKLMIILATAAIYVLTVLYNIISYGWISEFILTGAMYTSIIMMGVIPYFYSNAIICAAKSSRTLQGSFYSAVLGSLFMVLLASSYTLTKDLFIIMYDHDSIDLINYSLIFIFAILSMAFTRVMMYPRLIQEFNSDVLQTRRINESNKGIMNDDDFIPEDDFDEGIEESDESDNEIEVSGSKKASKTKTPKKDDFAFQTDNDFDGIMEDDTYTESEGLMEDDYIDEDDDGLMEDR